MPGQKVDEDMKVSRQWTSAPGFSILLPVSTGAATAGRRSLLRRFDEFLNCAARRAAYSRSVNRDLDAQSVFAREGHVVACRNPGGGGKLSGRWLPVLQI